MKRLLFYWKPPVPLQKSFWKVPETVKKTASRWDWQFTANSLQRLFLKKHSESRFW